MSPKREDPPSNLRSLEARISNIARERGRPLRRVQRVIANTVVGQMLPPSVVKGGTAMKLRVGEAASRFSADLDAARSAELTIDDYLDALAARLAEGWGGFTGELEELDPPQPEGVPDDYIMRPFVIRLAYQGRHWLSVPFELGHDEIGSTQRHELRVADDIVELFDIIGLDTPDPIPVLALNHQIAQKLHACTAINAKTGGNERAHDLVDLQILEQEEHIDYAALAATAQRLFAARRGQPWPPTVIAYERWDTIYAEAADGLDVIEHVDDAVAWANDFIARTAR
ncbi:MAG: nucleotidyl transferase AbiEii/AbiGii toxin family protein [Actinomycetota bacterium]|nr:nucleotidyl transferase AbiEii/AbiGii toxin family protein [Actinomycetota bacterium]